MIFSIANIFLHIQAEINENDRDSKLNVRIKPLTKPISNNSNPK